jgi:hypothetical protein
VNSLVSGKNSKKKDFSSHHIVYGNHSKRTHQKKNYFKTKKDTKFSIIFVTFLPMLSDKCQIYPLSALSEKIFAPEIVRKFIIITLLWRNT